MSRGETQTPEQHFERLPKNIAAAGALFTDSAGRVLVVKPHYRDHWLFVGGQLEEGETPEQACQRETKEEIGLDFEPGRLLLVEWTPPREGRPMPLIMFLFDGGTIEPGNIRLDNRELVAHRFLPPQQAIPLMSVNGQRRMPVALEALRTDSTFYRSAGT